MGTESSNKETEHKLLPVVNYMQVPDSNEPYLQGLKCTQCGAVYIDERKHCARCGARDALQDYRLENTGSVHAFTIVERSYPGIPVPFVSVIVDLDGGGTLKGNLNGIDAADRDRLNKPMKVTVNFEKAPWGDEAGNEYMLFNFKPAAGE